MCLVALSLVILMSAATCQLLTDLERAQILKAHWKARESVQPSASNMLLMVMFTLDKFVIKWSIWLVFLFDNKCTAFVII